MKNPDHFAQLVFVGSFCTLGSLFAQEMLDPLTVTGRRKDDLETQVPFTLEVLDRDFLEETHRRTLPEALQFTPGVLVQKTTHGHGSPFIRGFTGRQNLLLVDGVRINNSLTRSGPVQYWNTVDPYSIGHMELIKSQGSVVYGSDAVGGTLNALTLDSGFRSEPEGEMYSHGSAYYEYRSNGEGSHIGRIESSFGVGGQYGVMLGVTGKEFGDIEDSAVGLMRNTGYPEQDLDLKVEVALGPDTVMTFLHQTVNQDDVWRWHSTVFNPGWQHAGHVATPGSYLSRVYDQERSLTYLRFEGEPSDVAWLDRWSATLSYQTARDTESQDRSSSSGVDRRYQVAEIDTVGVDFSFESPLGDGSLVYGFDYYHDTVDSSGYRDRGAGLAFDSSFRPVANDSSYDLLGVYSQYVWSPVERVEVTAGGRFTHARAELGRYYDATTGSDAYGFTESWNNFSGSLRALWKIDDCWSLYGGVSQAFRAPNLNDLSGNVTARSGVAAQGSVDVDPEEFLTYELGSRFHRNDLSFGAAIFYTDIDGSITSVPVSAGSSTSVATNARDGYVYGVELDGEWRFAPQWSLSGFAAWQDGRQETNAYVGGPVVSETLSRIMPLTGSLALRWTHESEKVWVEGRVLAASEQDDLAASDQSDTQRIPIGGTPGYVTAMLYAGWRVHEHLELNCGLENLADVDYRNHGSGQNEPGFNAIFGAKVIW
ncbi:MAG: TonB-dependent receptor [Verrucomicrobiales bacterium]